MAAPAFGSAGTFLAGATSGTANFAVPVGVQAGDIILVHLEKETTSAVTAPAGFTEVTPAPTTTRNVLTYHLFWKRATGADSGTYNFTFASTWREGMATRYTGCVGTGVPFELVTSNSRSTAGTITPPVSLTTTAADRLLVWGGCSWSDSTWTAPTGFTLRGTPTTGVSVSVATRDWVTAGASGNVTGTGSVADDQAAWLLALLPVASSPSTLVNATTATLAVAAHDPTVTSPNATPPDAALGVSALNPIVSTTFATAAPAVSIVQTSEAFTTTATTTDTFSTSPAPGALVLGIVSVNKNAGSFTATPTGFTVRQTHVATSVSGSVADAAGVDGGIWTWSGTGVNAWGVAGFIETDVTDWAYRNSVLVTNTETGSATISADLGAAPSSGVVFAIAGIDSSWDAQGPFTATTVFTGGYEVVGLFQDADSASPYGGASFIVGMKELATGDPTSTSLSWTGPDQAWMVLTQYDVNTEDSIGDALTAAIGVSALNPSISTVGETPGTLSSAWLGIECINLRLSGGSGDVRVNFSLDSAMTSPVSSSLVTPDSLGNARVPIPASLAPDTTYFYRAFRASTYLGTAQQFTTIPIGGTFKFGFASCRDTVRDADVLATLIPRGASFFLNLGDIHYRDINSTDVNQYRSAYDDLWNSSYADLNNTLEGVPNAYVWSDHDFCGNASDRTFAGKPAVQQAYRERVPHMALPSSTGIYQTFRLGRIRFILLDTRSFRDPMSTKTDGTMLGTEQKLWLQNLLANADTPLTFMISAEGWHSQGNEDDDWGWYQDERSEVAGWISSSATEVVVLCGDMHRVTYATPAQGTPGGVHVWHAGAINQFDNNIKGGPYAVTPYFHAAGQYGLVTIDESATTLTATFNVVRQGTTDWAESDSVSVEFEAEAVTAAVAVQAFDATVTSGAATTPLEGAFSVSALDAVASGESGISAATVTFSVPRTYAIATVLAQVAEISLVATNTEAGNLIAGPFISQNFSAAVSGTFYGAASVDTLNYSAAATAVELDASVAVVEYEATTSYRGR